MDPTSRSAALYYRLPVFAQNLAIMAAGIQRRRTRFGADFDKQLAFLRDSAGWERNRIEAYADSQVARLVKHAYDDTPLLPPDHD